MDMVADQSRLHQLINEVLFWSLEFCILATTTLVCWKKKRPYFDMMVDYRVNDNLLHTDIQMSAS